MNFAKKRQKKKTGIGSGESPWFETRRNDTKFSKFITTQNVSTSYFEKDAYRISQATLLLQLCATLFPECRICFFSSRISIFIKMMSCNGNVQVLEIDFNGFFRTTRLGILSINLNLGRKGWHFKTA